MTALPPIRLLLPCPNSKPGNVWGDLFYGQALERAFHRAGQETRLQLAPRNIFQKSPRRLFGGEIDLVLRGKYAHRPASNRPFFMWLYTNPGPLTKREKALVKHVFVASPVYAEKLRAEGIATSLVPQATDPTLFYPTGTTPEGILFVGNRRKDFVRPVVSLAIEHGLRPQVWGRGWEKHIQHIDFMGRQISNDALGRAYANAQLVLNDHISGMLEGGFVSNRLYDVLATGRPVLNEDMDGIPDDLRPFVYTYHDGPSLKQAADAALSETSRRSRERKAFAKHVAQNHSFDARARVMLALIAETLGVQARLPDQQQPQQQTRAQASRASLPQLSTSPASATIA